MLAPCVLPILPIILGAGADNRNKKGLFLLIGSLSLSIVVFTLLLRASTLLIDIPNEAWTTLSGGILIFFGFITIFPQAWDAVSKNFNSGSKKLLNKAGQNEGYKREIAIGLALGPVFTSCSPTYALIIAAVLPASFIQGVFYTIIYALGLAMVLTLIGLTGRRFTKMLQFSADPNGKLKKAIGIVLLVVGLSILLGWDKDLEAFIIDQGYFGITPIEQRLLEGVDFE